MAVELDSLTIKDLEARYGVARSNVYNRINGLKEKGYPLEPEKRGAKSIFSADQVQVMDALDSHIKAGNEIASFPSNGHTDLLRVSQDTWKPSHRTQDITRGDESKMVGVLLGALASLQPSQPDPLANLELLERVAEKGWLLSTSQLAPLLGLKSLHGSEFCRAMGLCLPGWAGMGLRVRGGWERKSELGGCDRLPSF